MSRPVYPQNVINRILQLTLATQVYAYLALDDQGILQSADGDLESMGLPPWQPGDNVLDQALFLQGSIPADADYLEIPTVQLDDSTVFDVHIYRDNQLNWVLLVNQSEQIQWQSKARQKSNELRLLEQRVEYLESRLQSEFEFFKALNMMALRKVDDEQFQRLQPVADSFREVYPECFEGGDLIQPQKKFPFLENFLVDAEEVWNSSTRKRVCSGPWIEQTGEGEEIALEATAINANGCQLLFIELLDEHYQQYHDVLQIGREGMLLKSFLEEEVRSRTRQIREREEEIALRLVCAADTRDDGETGSHIRRLGLYSELMARRLGWPQDQVDEIRIAAPMHDIGKIGIPDSILRKPGKLDDAEFRVMKRHSEIGGRILSNSQSSLVQMAREIALGHHEKWDGTGYPNGLAGEAIPVSARIVAIVDVFDALIHERVYKRGISIERALEIMREGSGKHFDPQLFDLFFELRNEMAEIAKDFSDPLCGRFEDDRAPAVVAAGASD